MVFIGIEDGAININYLLKNLPCDHVLVFRFPGYGHVNTMVTDDAALAVNAFVIDFISSYPNRYLGAAKMSISAKASFGSGMSRPRAESLGVGKSGSCLATAVAIAITENDDAANETLIIIYQFMSLQLAFN